jgi:thiamine biosynthesis lipoprotein
MQRREFLDPKRLLHTAGALHAVLKEPEGTPAAQSGPPDALLLHFSRSAMATIFEVVFPFGTSQAHAAALEALDLVDVLEEQMTVYREGSEVNDINHRAAASAIPVEENLFSLFQVSERLYRETGGAFDIAAGKLIKAWGFFRGPPQVPSPEELKLALAVTGTKHLKLDVEQRTIRFHQPGLELNLGSIGKGYALDRAVELLANRWGMTSALLHGGRSSVLALGHAPGSTCGWAVGITHPWNPAARLVVVQLQDQALGTSAATFKHLVHEGRKLGHILDPRTGWPAAGVASASVLAPTAAEADALATAFYVRGEAFAREYCAAHPELGAVMLVEGQSRPSIFGRVLLSP